MTNTQHTRSATNRPATRRVVAAGAVVALALVLGGCVGAAPSGGASPATVTAAPPAAGAPGQPSAAASPEAQTPGDSLLGTTPCSPAGDSAQACGTFDAPTPIPATPSPASTPAAAPAPTPARTSSPGTGTPSTVRVTQADNGATIHLAVGQQILLDLGSSVDWTVTVADQDVISRVPGVLVVKGAQGIYAARAAGSTNLSAIGSPHCTSGICPLYRIAFQVTITVH